MDAFLRPSAVTAAKSLTVVLGPSAGVCSPDRPSGLTTIVANPTAGHHEKKAIASIAQRLRDAGREVEIVETDRTGSLREFARTCDARTLLVAGGDGSVNEAVTGLLERAEPRPVLGIIPQGTANILGAELGLPGDVEGLVDVFLNFRLGRLHLGLANGRPFVLMASVGFDAEVVRTVSLPLKRKIGKWAYVLAALKLCLQRRLENVEVRVGEEVFDAKLVVVTNSKFYGGQFVIDKEASVLRPGLSVVALPHVDIASLLWLGFLVAFGDASRTKLVRRMPAQRVEVRSRIAVATQVDGDALGITPILISKCPDTIEVLTA